MSHWDTMGLEVGPAQYPVTFGKGHLFGTSFDLSFTNDSLIGDGFLEGLDICYSGTLADQVKVTAQYDAAFFFVASDNFAGPESKYYSWRGRLRLSGAELFVQISTVLNNADLSIFMWGRYICLNLPGPS